MAHEVDAALVSLLQFDTWCLRINWSDDTISSQCSWVSSDENIAFGVLKVYQCVVSLKKCSSCDILVLPSVSLNI